MSPAALPVPKFPNASSNLESDTTRSKELYPLGTNENNSTSDVKFPESRTPVNLAPDSTSLEEETLDVDRRFSSDRRRRRPTSRSPRQFRRDNYGVGKNVIIDGKIVGDRGVNREDVGDGDIEDEVDINELCKLQDNLESFSPRLGNKIETRFGHSNFILPF